ncbi:hypothetical protein TcasGA2_TC032078 [Tribolium castaneum]|uniref:Uncharacterized protein n=1 Tax=Tribolium castaneum TaxID=7070 RepID=A0A139WMG2_TRICA|nr:hypothetical protein TcasGA2_TC032078 [Tribolium castaneum]
MCSLCPRKKPPPKKAVRFDSYVDTFSISDTSMHRDPKLMSDS